jgi:hypothetical protein
LGKRICYWIGGLRCQETDKGTVVLVSDGILAHFLETFLKERMNSTVHNAKTRKSKKQLPTIVAADRLIPKQTWKS